MKRVVIVGRGASGKSTLARRLGDITGLLVTEVDKIFWQPGLSLQAPTAVLCVFRGPKALARFVADVGRR
jgi:dephospho-CoA kinase